MQPHRGAGVSFVAAVLTFAAGCSAAAEHSYPVCTLPLPYQATNFKDITRAGFLEACVDISANADHVQAWDLQSLQLVVAGQCHNAVDSVSFDGKQYTPTIITYDMDNSVGVKITAQPSLSTHAQLINKPAKFCIRLKSPCLTKQALNNVVLFEPVEGIQGVVTQPACATTSLFTSHDIEPGRLPTHAAQQVPSWSVAPLAQPPQIFGHPARRALKDMCPPQLQCGTDRAGQDNFEFAATFDTTERQISNAPFFEFVNPTTFTVNECCIRCREQTTARCNSFVVRAGTCFLKQYPLSAYPVKNTGIGCPPTVSPDMLVSDVKPDVSIIGAGCACS